MHHGSSCIGVGYWGVWRRDAGRVRLLPEAKLMMLSQVTGHTISKMYWDPNSNRLIWESMRGEQGMGIRCVIHGAYMV